VRALRQDGSEVDVELEIDMVELQDERRFRAVLR
jgi:hypothetical protein